MVLYKDYRRWGNRVAPIENIFKHELNGVGFGARDHWYAPSDWGFSSPRYHIRLGLIAFVFSVMGEWLCLFWFFFLFGSLAIVASTAMLFFMISFEFFLFLLGILANVAHPCSDVSGVCFFMYSCFHWCSLLLLMWFWWHLTVSMFFRIVLLDFHIHLDCFIRFIRWCTYREVFDNMSKWIDRIWRNYLRSFPLFNSGVNSDFIKK